MPQAHSIQRSETDIGSLFLTSTMRALVRELRSPGLAVNTFTSRLTGLYFTSFELRMPLPHCKSAYCKDEMETQPPSTGAGWGQSPDQVGY